MYNTLCLFVSPGILNIPDIPEILTIPTFQNSSTIPKIAIIIQISLSL